MKTPFSCLGICLILLVLIISCSRNLDSTIVNDQNLFLTLADSLKHSDPQRADSLYRIILTNSNDNNANLSILALCGLSEIYVSLSNYDTAADLLNQAELISMSTSDTSLLVLLNLTKGNFYLDLGDYEKAESAYKTGLEVAKKSGNKTDQHLFTLSLATLLKERGDYTEAIRTYTEAVELAEQSGSIHNQALALENIGLILIGNGDFRGAYRYMNKSLMLKDKANMRKEYAMGLMNLGILYRQMGNYDSSLICYRVAGNEFTQLKDANNLVRVKYNTGIILKNQQKYDQARNNISEVLIICREKGILEGEVLALHALASIFKEEGNVEEGLRYSDNAIALAKERKMVRSLDPFLKQKEVLLAKAGKYKEAYSLSLEGIVLADSLMSLDTRNEISRLETKFQTSQKESENTNLRHNLQMQRSDMFWLRLLILVLLLAVMLVILIFRYRIKIQKQLIRLSEEKSIREKQTSLYRELELKKVQLETELKEARIGELENKARLKEQELLFQSLIRIDLSNVNRSVRKNLMPFSLKLRKKKDREEFIRSLDEIAREAARDPMTVFEQSFNQLHPSFMEKLLSHSSELNRSEIHICSLIKLNFSSKDIAHLLNLSVSTVETTRHNIRKKLELNNAESLPAFLIKI